ncbi:MAG: hypothetical protein HXX10_07450 [Rhodoplanes sp.]|uniref:hypothetical protein n=1 Tax=Rhodoplanes sp. TaxID=1968906 RepID=UPI0018380140|nr:hypothetical protein [Rhodoplanes sp.]NVO13855.1 hypothetical protein [Rhodoplanes sp.]
MRRLFGTILIGILLLPFMPLRAVEIVAQGALYLIDWLIIGRWGTNKILAAVDWVDSRYGVFK